VPLTDTQLRQAKPGEKPYRLLDAEGLHLEIRPTGAKVWIYRYWISPTKNGLYTIGNYPSVSLKEARLERDKAKELVRQGLNPTREKKLNKVKALEERELTFSVVAERWRTENEPHWGENYKRQIRTFLQRDLLDELGDLRIKDVSSAHILSALKKIEARGAKSIAKLVRQWAGGIMRYAIRNLLIEQDPTYALRGSIKMPTPKHHAHLEAHELPSFLKALSQYQGNGLVPLAVRLQLLTFVRTIELRHAEWSEFDLAAGVWRIPAEKMKMNETHIIPLSKQAIDLIKKIEETNWRKSNYLFPNARRPDDCITVTTILRAIENMGFKGKLTGHGFRGTASTILHENGWDAELIERQLAHTEKNKVKAAYNHAAYLPKRREMMQWWADYLDQQSSQTHGSPF